MGPPGQKLSEVAEGLCQHCLYQTARSDTSSGRKNGENRKKNWRQNLNLFTGIAVCNEGNTTLSSDVDLGGYGVAKNATAL